MRFSRLILTFSTLFFLGLSPAQKRLVTEQNRYSRDYCERIINEKATAFLDADDVDAITYDSNNRVSAWADSLGLVNDFTQSTDANKPILTRADNRENLLKDTSNITSSANWSATNCNVAEVDIEPPPGLEGHTVYELSDGTNTGNHYIKQEDFYNWSGLGLVHTISVYFKLPDTNYQQYVQLRFAFYQNVSINLETGNYSSNMDSAIVESVGDGWYHLQGTASSPELGFHDVMLRLGYTDYTGSNDSVYFCAPQLILGDRSSGYIATGSAPQHRGVNGHRSLKFFGGQELESTTNLEDILGNSNKTLYVVFRPDLINAGDLQTLLKNKYGGNGLAIESGTDDVVAQIYDGVVNEATLSGYSVVPDTPFIARMRHDGTTLYVSADGGSESSVPAGATDNGQEPTNVGGRDTNDYSFGNIAAIVTFDKQLTDFESTTIERCLARRYGANYR